MRRAPANSQVIVDEEPVVQNVLVIVGVDNVKIETPVPPPIVGMGGKTNVEPVIRRETGRILVLLPATVDIENHIAIGVHLNGIRPYPTA